MIGVHKQYRYQFTIGVLEDFINEGEIEMFRVIERAGNSLPEFELSFQYHKEDLLKYINEGNVLQVTYGPDNDRDELKTAEFFITKVESKKATDSIYLLVLTGLLNRMGYLTDRKMRLYPNQSGYEVLRSIFSPYSAQIDMNPTVSEDLQTWIQPNITDRAFVNEVWMHSYLSQSFTGLALLSNGHVRIRDLQAYSSQVKGRRWDWKLVSSMQDPATEIGIDSTTALNNSSGFINNVLGYGRQKRLHQLEAGTTGSVTENAFAPFLAVGAHNRSADLLARADLPEQLSLDNVDAHYWEAFLQNLVNLGVFSSCAVSVMAHQQYRDVYPLDLVFLEEPSIENRVSGESSLYQAGLYIVTKVTRIIQSRRISMILELVRSTMNSGQGALR